MMIRSVVLSVLVFAGCAVSGEAGTGTATETDEASALSSPAQAQAVTCEQRCQFEQSICESRCARDPFDPQNDCGCGDAHDLCVQRCSVP